MECWGKFCPLGHKAGPKAWLLSAVLSTGGLSPGDCVALTLASGPQSPSLFSGPQQPASLVRGSWEVTSQAGKCPQGAEGIITALCIFIFNLREILEATGCQEMLSCSLCSTGKSGLF